jgi:alcohol dehydrogenase class IV
MLLPPVLRWCLAETAPRLALLARAVNLAGSDTADDTTAAGAFVDAVQALADGIGIPRRCAALHEADIPALAEAACREADLNYPVPRRMSRDEAAALLRGLLDAEGPADAGTPARRSRRPGARP